jgi:hypothetical protein
MTRKRRSNFPQAIRGSLFRPQSIQVSELESGWVRRELFRAMNQLLCPTAVVRRNA